MALKPDCKEKILPAKMISHLNEKHKWAGIKEGKKSNVFRGCQSLTNLDEGPWMVVQLLMDKENFFLEIYKKGFLVYFWVFMLAPEEKTRDIFYSIKITDNKKVSNMIK